MELKAYKFYYLSEILRQLYLDNVIKNNSDLDELAKLFHAISNYIDNLSGVVDLKLDSSYGGLVDILNEIATEYQISLVKEMVLHLTFHMINLSIKICID